MKRQAKNQEDESSPKCNLPFPSKKLCSDVYVPFILFRIRIDGITTNTKMKMNGISNLFVFLFIKGIIPPYVLKNRPDNIKYNGMRKKNIIWVKSR